MLSSRLMLLAALAAVLLLVAQCGGEPASADYVARVGDQYLTQAELRGALRYVPPGRDTADARQQVVGQWVRGALLYQEAERRGLRADSAVQQRLRESERSVLISALIGQMRAQAGPPTTAEMQGYFAQHREQLRLREPFVRLRYLTTDRLAAAQEARRALLEAVEEDDAAARWPRLVRRFASDTATARRLSESYYPQQQLFTAVPAARTVLEGLRPGRAAPVFEAGGRFYVLQLVDRLPAGTMPEPAWVEGEVRRRLLIQRRKQIITRQVQRLRNEATARGELMVSY